MPFRSVGTSLKAGSVVDQLIERITDAIIQKELLPGERLPSETELTEMFQVGKSSVREAIKVLQALGILEVHRGDGTFISPNTKGAKLNPTLYQMMMESSSIEKLYELREIFEPAYTLLAMKNATPEDIENIRQAKDRFEELTAEQKQTGQDDIEFHRNILLATHNPYVIRIGEMILKLLTESVNRGCTNQPQIAIRDHNEIYDAFISGDPVRLEKAEQKSFLAWADETP